MLAQLRQIFEDDLADEELTIERAILAFAVRFLAPNGENEIEKVLLEARRAMDANQQEFERMLADFGASKWERLDEYMDVLDHFFRAYDEFNQTLVYVRLKRQMPEEPYAPSADFENTKLYYGEAFEALGSSLDLPVAINNIVAGRQYDQLNAITLTVYRSSDKGRRSEAVRGNPELLGLVDEYDNRLRNASHHRWLRLSNERSELSYRDGGNGAVQRLSYADYLKRCCAITAQLLVLAAVEAVLFS